MSYSPYAIFLLTIVGHDAGRPQRTQSSCFVVGTSGIIVAHLCTAALFWFILKKASLRCPARRCRPWSMETTLTFPFRFEATARRTGPRWATFQTGSVPRWAVIYSYGGIHCDHHPRAHR